MNFRSTVAPPDSSRKLLVAFVFVLIFVAAAYEFSELVLAGDMMGFAYVALLGVGGVFIITILNNWRNGVYFFFTWLLFEDLAHKYLGNNIMNIAIIVSAWKVVRKLRGSPWFPIAFSMFLYATLLLIL